MVIIPPHCFIHSLSWRSRRRTGAWVTLAAIRSIPAVAGQPGGRIRAFGESGGAGEFHHRRERSDVRRRNPDLLRVQTVSEIPCSRPVLARGLGVDAKADDYRVANLGWHVARMGIVQFGCHSGRLDRRSTGGTDRITGSTILFMGAIGFRRDVRVGHVRLAA